MTIRGSYARKPMCVCVSLGAQFVCLWEHCLCVLGSTVCVSLGALFVCVLGSTVCVSLGALPPPNPLVPRAPLRLCFPSCSRRTTLFFLVSDIYIIIKSWVTVALGRRSLLGVACRRGPRGQPVVMHVRDVERLARRDVYWSRDSLLGLGASSIIQAVDGANR